MVVSDRIRGIEEYEGVSVEVGPTCHEPGCRGYGNPDSGIVFIGIAPGKTEVRSGRPFTGASGRLLTNLLNSLGIHRNQVYCTNLICWYKDDPSPLEAEKCASRLRKELLALKPRLIICAGKIVTEIFTGYQFGKIRGAVQWSSLYNCYIMSTYHPSAILRGMNEYGSSKDDKASAMVYDLVRDLRKVKNVLEWMPEAPDAKVEYTVVNEVEEAQRILYSLPTNEPVALDVETRYDKDEEDGETELLSDKLLCVGVGTTTHAYVFTPNALKDSNNTPALDWPNLQWTMHNAIFDAQVIKSELDVWLEIKEDTMLQSYSLDERSGIHRLKTLAREYLGAGFWEQEGRGNNRSKRIPLDELPPEILYNYNAHDVVYTARLCKLFTKWQYDDGVREMYERILIPCVNMYKEVSHHGVHIDARLHREFAIKWINKWMEDETLLQEMAKEEGWTDNINLNSPQQLGEFIYRVLSLPIIKYTKNGAPSTDKESLEALRNQHEFVNALIEFRRLTKMISIYIFKLQKNIKADGRAHPTPKLHSSRTGRPSLVNPEVQTIPVPYSDKEGMDVEYAKLRELFTVTPVPETDNDPYVFIEADFGKAEIWMAVTYSGDQQMYSDLISGDYHTQTCADIFEKPISAVTKQDRVDTKRIVFGIMYDREANSLSKAINRSPIEAQRYIDRFFMRNHQYSNFFERTKQDIQANGELVTYTGRKRRIMIVGSPIRAMKQAVNYPIQSTASDVLIDAAVEVHRTFKERKLDAFLLFTVHDAILAECRKSQVDEVCKIIHNAMTARRFDKILPIPVEIKVGKSWGSSKEIHDCSRGAYDPVSVRGNKWGGGYCLWPETS